MSFIIKITRDKAPRGVFKTTYVVADAGWSWAPEGLERATFGAQSPEIHERPDRALHFKSHRAAARVANKLATFSTRRVEILEVNW